VSPDNPRVEEDVRPAERIDPPKGDEGEAAYRGFLFADLRGYTAFGERHGDAAAADLLDAYRELVRSEVARQADAEIRTEGDSFYVVFRSAQGAGFVQCSVRPGSRRSSSAVGLQVDSS
jgi:class 3 adenylate cyclase